MVFASLMHLTMIYNVRFLNRITTLIDVTKTKSSLTVMRLTKILSTKAAEIVQFFSECLTQRWVPNQSANQLAVYVH